MKKMLLLLLLTCTFAKAQMKHENNGTKFVTATSEIRENPIDSTIISVITIPMISTGNPNDVFTDDIGCTKEYAVSRSEFATLLQAVQSEINEEAKLNTAFRFARKSCLNAAQITQICKSLGLEKTRLDFAKFAFSACVDPKNYSIVHSVFQQKAHVSDLTMFITGR